jgi:iron complex outermembrane receptor protein
MNKQIITIATILFSIIYANASDDFSDFLNEIENTTKIATKNKINADYAPGIITILKSDDLKRRGIKNFYEAIQLIPSIDIHISPTGTKNMIIRGVGGITGSGKTKIMINGVGQNSNASGIIHYNLPIDIIDTIEVIRGPASALYGEYAFSGVINIITKKEITSVFDLKSSNGNTAGTTYFYKQKDLVINAILSYTNDKGVEPLAQAKVINYMSVPPTITTKTHNIETLRKEQNFILNIKYNDFIANIALNKAKKGEFYGLVSTLPNNNNKENFIYDYKTIELLNQFKINSNLSITPKIGYFDYDYYMDSTFPPSISTSKYTKKYLILDNLYNYKSNELLIGAEYSTIKEKTNSLNTRDLSAIYVHDNIKLSNKFSINSGIRYEYYNDNNNDKLTNYILPRVATIYKYNNSIFKFQYGQAYRAPTFLEGSNIDSERISTYEMQYILKNGNNQFLTTLFHSTIKNLIIKDPTISRTIAYKNENEDIVSKGIELEFVYNFDNNFLVNSNISYSDVYYKKTKQNLINYSKILSNISLSYLPYSRFSSTINLRYIGSQNRDILDTREKLKAQVITDVIFKYLLHKAQDNVELLFGIKNISDINIKSPSKIGTIDDDLVYDQRELFIGVTYKF